MLNMVLGSTLLQLFSINDLQFKSAPYTCPA
jgi:hypothetical protein